MRNLGAAATLLLVATFVSSGLSLADQQQVPLASAWLNFRDPAGAPFVESRVESDAGTPSDCDHSAASDGDKSDQASSGDDSSDASDHTDGAEDDDADSAAQATKSTPDQKDGDSASSEDDNHGCEPQDADASDASDDQDPAAVSAPDDEQRNYRETKVDLYRDSQGYKTATVTSHEHLVIDNFFLNLTHSTVAASDAASSVRSEETMFSFLANLNENLGVGGGFGSVYSQGWSLPVGSLKTTANLEEATIEAGVSRSLLATSAQTIRHRIMLTDASANISYEITKDFVPSLEFHHIAYSDNNRSIGVDFTPQYTFHLDESQLQLGYEFSYQSFAMNPDHGYWAPRKALSNGMSGTWSFDRTDYYGHAQLGLSYDSVRESGKLADGPSGGPGASAEFAFGIRPTNDTTLETYWTGQGSSGWSSMNVGISLKYFFGP